MGRAFYTEAMAVPDIDFADRMPKVFLAGGITNCPDWQADLWHMLSRLAGMDARNIEFMVYNPRRANFPIGDPDAAQEQIKWEYKALQNASVHSFWFSRGSLNPIALFEYGAAMEYSNHIVVGCDPEYERIEDVRIQTELRHPKQRVHAELQIIANEIFYHLCMVGEKAFGWDKR